MPLLPALFLIFLTLKLCEVITWSWWLVFAPLLAIPAILLGAVVIAVIYAGIKAKVKTTPWKRR